MIENDHKEMICSQMKLQTENNKKGNITGLLVICIGMNHGKQKNQNLCGQHM